MSFPTQASVGIYPKKLCHFPGVFRATSGGPRNPSHVARPLRVKVSTLQETNHDPT